jgi:MOSC domain-containing protein YiiM
MYRAPMSLTLAALLAGRIAPFRAPDEPSAIAKTPLQGKVRIGPLGIEGDEQADRLYHGGPDKALHHYPADHYDFWRAEIGDHPLFEAPGAFGENIAVTGLVETEACLGDRYRLGSATIELSHGRQPCWKQGHRLGRSEMVARMVATGRSGWYYRVLEPGEAQAGDAFALIDRPLPEWTVARIFGLLVAGDHKRDPAAVRALAAMPVLAEAWRWRARELAG